MVSQFREARLKSADLTADNFISICNSQDTKPRTRRPIRTIKNIHPLLIQHLSVGETCRQRFLCGTVAIEDAFFTDATSLLLEDISGMLIPVSIYNIPDASTAKASSIFPKGCHVAIIEPFFKRRSDMTNGIHVEDSREVVEWNMPKKCMEWKEPGNGFMRSQPPTQDGALICYNAALERVPQSFLQSKAEPAALMTNISVCKRKSKEFLHSVRYAAVASGLDPSNVKARCLLEESILEMGISSGIRDISMATSSTVEGVRASPLIPQKELPFDELSAIIQTEESGAGSSEPNFDAENTWVRTFSAESAWCFIPSIVERTDLDSRCASQKKTSVALCDARSTGSVFFDEGKTKEAETCFFKQYSILMT